MKKPRSTIRCIRLLAATWLLACGSSKEEPAHEASAPQRTSDAAQSGSSGSGPSASTVAAGAPATQPPGSTASIPPAADLTVTSPPDVGIAQVPVDQFVNLEDYGYEDTEYFFEGQATAYTAKGALGTDGKWELDEAGTAPYRTRLYVRRPKDANKFNGTVVIEWLNVSGGADGDPGYMYNHQLALREGWAWVSVSAQAVGVQGGGFSIASLGNLGGLGGMSAGAMTSQEGVFGAPLKQFDPVRYKELTHPGDDYSYDIFTQAARLVRGQGEGAKILSGLEPKRVIAYGESQSAGRLTSYVDGVAPMVTTLFDGYFIHSRGASGSGFTSDPNDLLAGFIGGGTPHHIRDDLGVPVFQFQTETDVHGMLAFLPARQPDTDMLRTWEVAGTSHADVYLTNLGGGIASSVGLDCKGANDGPQQFVIKAALRSLDRWIADGTQPPKGTPLEVDSSGTPVADDNGNTRGGVRSPDVDVPIAILSGDAAAGDGANLGSGGSLSLFCGIFGSTTPFSPEKLMSLYSTHEDYVKKVEAAAKSVREAGFLLEPEEQAMVEEARTAAVPN